MVRKPDAENTQGNPSEPYAETLASLRVELVQIRERLNALREDMCGDGEGSIMFRLSKIEERLFKLYHEQGVLLGKVAIISAIISASIGAVVSLLMR